MKNTTNIAFISYTFSFGGIQKSMLMIAQQLKDHGYQFHFISTYLDDFQSQFYDSGKCCLITDENEVITYLVENKIDIVQLNHSEYGAYLAYLAGIKGILERVDGIKSAFLLDKTPVDSIISSTKSVFKKSKELYPEKYNIQIVNGVDLNRFALADKNLSLRQEFGIAVDDIVIGYSGRMSEEKCLDKLIDVFRNLANEKSNIKLAVLGSTTRPNEQKYHNYLLKKVENLKLTKKIFFLPQTESPEKVMNLFDIGVYTAGTYLKPDGSTGVTVEGYTNALLELCAMGIPIVTTNSGDVSGVIKNNYNGYVVGLDDMNAFHDKLLELINNSALRCEMGKNGRKFITENFNLSQMSNNYDALYRYVLSNNLPGEYPGTRKNIKNHHLGNPFEIINQIKDKKKILIFRSGSLNLFDALIKEVNEKFITPEISILCHKNNSINRSKNSRILKKYYYKKSDSFDVDKMEELLEDINKEIFDYLFFINNDFLGRGIENISKIIKKINVEQKILVTSICGEFKQFIFA